MNIQIFLLKGLRKIYRTFQQGKDWVGVNVLQKRLDPYEAPFYEKRVQLFDQEANDFVKELIQKGKPCMISKFGTIELSALVQYKSIHQQKYGLSDYLEFIKGQRPTLWWQYGINRLCSNAGFFPNETNLLRQYFKINKVAIKNIDVLGSYLYHECFFDQELKQAKRINIDGYYAPFYYKNPWTIALEGKKVLVVHPFEDSIKTQYQKRKFIWGDKDVLPEFELITLKAVQTMLGQSCEYETWFEALESMKIQMSEIDFDIALIGCGAYGMPLASYVKEMGKQAVHLAGWTQILFGIKGKRWIDMPSVAKYMNEYWIHPSKTEVLKEYQRIEEGCYW